MQDEVADTGLMMMGHRFYAPDLGRFLNRDPIGFRGGPNLFEYAGGRPTHSTDATGLQEETKTWGQLLKEAFFGTFNTENAKRFGLSLLEAMDFLSPKSMLVNMGLDAASGEGGGNGEAPLLPILGLGRYLKGALRRSLRNQIQAGDIIDCPGGWNVNPGAKLRTRTIYKRGDEIDQLENLVSQYPETGLTQKQWKKIFGNLEMIDEYGNIEIADIHWFEHPNVDVLHQLKFKDWLYE